MAFTLEQLKGLREELVQSDDPEKGKKLDAIEKQIRRTEEDSDVG